MKKRLLVYLLLSGSAFAQRAPWTGETSSITSNQAGDPAVVFVPPSTQVIVGTDTAQTGAYFWSVNQLQNPQVQLLGLVNSADARGPLVLISSATANSLVAFEVLPGGALLRLDTGAFNTPSPRHVALAQRANGQLEVYVDTSNLSVEHHGLTILDGGISFTPLTPLSVAELPSGLAVDDRTGRLYVGQPSLGILAIEANGNSSFLVSIDAGTLGTSVGGVDLFLLADGGALVLSTAPNQAEVKVHSPQGAFLTSLTFGDTDGGPANLGQPQSLDVFERPTPGFPRGLLVLQDAVTANYKLVSLADFDDSFPFPQPFLTPDLDGGAPPPTDAGVMDGGQADAGSPGAGGGMGTGRPPGDGNSANPTTPSCGCTGGPFAFLPVLLLLWWIRRLRTTHS